MAKRILSFLPILIGTLLISTTSPLCHANSSKIRIDLNNDGKEEIGIIENSKAYIYSGEELLFESDPDWDVKEIIAGDLNNDGQNDFALSLWKNGNYGSSKPFWVEENDNSYKMHLFLYTWKNEQITPLWHSSNLPKENIKIRLTKNEKDQTQITVIERDYTETENKEWLSVAVWKWNNWGFQLEKRIFIKNFFSY